MKEKDIETLNVGFASLKRYSPRRKKIIPNVMHYSLNTWTGEKFQEEEIFHFFLYLATRDISSRELH